MCAIRVTQKIVSADESDMRLDRWFKLHFPGLGFGDLQKLLRSGQIRLDGRRIKSSERIRSGSRIRIPPLDDSAMRHRPLTQNTMRDKSDKTILDSMVLYEDKSLYVFNKPSGLAVQGGSGISRSVDSILESFRSSSGEKPRLVHRLDRDTSGVLVVAKTRSASVSLTRSFRDRRTRKTYWSLVAGIPPRDEGRLSCYLEKYRSDDGDKMRVVPHGVSGSVHAISHYRIIDKSARKVSWVELHPVSGRTHQLRVQMADLGTPIIGDTKYFNLENWQLPGGIQHRLHLHSRRIEIPHPSSGTPMLDITAPLPPHMEQSWNLLGFDETESDLP